MAGGGGDFALFPISAFPHSSRLRMTSLLSLSLSLSLSPSPALSRTCHSMSWSSVCRSAFRSFVGLGRTQSRPGGKKARSLSEALAFFSSKVLALALTQIGRDGLLLTLGLGLLAWLLCRCCWTTALVSRSGSSLLGRFSRSGLYPFSLVDLLLTGIRLLPQILSGCFIPFVECCQPTESTAQHRSLDLRWGNDGRHLQILVWHQKRQDASLGHQLVCSLTRAVDQTE